MLFLLSTTLGAHCRRLMLGLYRTLLSRLENKYHQAQLYRTQFTVAAMETGLGNQAILAKIDKLRELNVGSMIPLPQVRRSRLSLRARRRG